MRPAATAAYPKGTRVRCTRCHTWFPIAEGTVWEPRKARSTAAEPLPEGGQGEDEEPPPTD